jgi:hypothetical protein
MLRPLLLLTLSLLAATAAARPSDADEARIRAAVERGRLLFELDRAAWVTTDDMLKRFGRRDMPIKGWVTERDGADGYRVTYFGDGPSGPVAWYSGRVRGGKVTSGEVYPEAARPALTAAQLRLRQAADVARGFTEYRPCTPARFNVAVVPAESADAPLDAYLLSAQTVATVYPVGGHYLLRVGPDGRVLSHRRFMNSCMNVDTASQPKGATTVGLMLSHLLDPVPTEIHVWSSLAMRKPIFVATTDPQRVWSVEGSRIRLLKE